MYSFHGLTKLSLYAMEEAFIPGFDRVTIGPHMCVLYKNFALLHMVIQLEITLLWNFSYSCQIL